MDRAVKDITLLERFVLNFVRVVEKHARYIVVSGFVVIAHGRARGTEDIDMILERIPKSRFLKLHRALGLAGFQCVQTSSGTDVYDRYLADNLSIRYVLKGTFVPEMEVKFAKDELDNYQLGTRKKIPLTGLDIYYSSIEANIAFKEELLKSEKDMEDAKHLREVYKDGVSEQEINHIKKMIRKLR
ncbi:MAG: hypothetical protein V1743_06300 [Nanoarchaeota archaeon]